MQECVETLVAKRVEGNKVSKVNEGGSMEVVENRKRKLQGKKS